MSAKDIKNLMHYSNVIMKPFGRLLALSLAGSVVYLLLAESKPVVKIRPNYLEYRKAKGLPDIELKYVAGFVKEEIILPRNEEPRGPTN